MINSLTGNVGSNVGGGAAFGGGLDSPRMSDSPASDYLRQNSSGLSSKHKVRNHHPRSQSRTPIDATGGAGLDASAHLLTKLNELAQGGQENGLIS